MTILCFAPPAPAGNAMWRTLCSLVSVFLARRAERIAASDLAHMSDRMRADIGLPPRDPAHPTFPAVGFGLF
ncbi:DUF1127 domain-containing protein [Jannaschia formosa]|uniref:DUF1127 domain-containing protein n=1 Tax=Jannaschia formosa TaxID=2259592 RepID=UPI000E1B8C0F|nr:DUF1127 domain-containing protein [Jannaschia formosa]TFL16552.1 DUF1127 domain-containing protein [Jannaschia formosa]